MGVSRTSARVAIVGLASGIGGSPERWRAFTEACHRFSPRVVLREGEAVFLDLCGITFETRSLEARVRAVAQRLGVTGVRLAFAPCAWEALARLRGFAGNLAIPADPSQISLEALEGVLAPFEFDEKTARIAHKMREAFELLGITQLEEVARLPADDLGARFGESGLVARTRILGRSDPPWPVFRAAVRVFESQDFEAAGGCESMEALMFPLRALIDRAMARLRGRGERAARVRVRLRLERGAPVSERRWEWRLPLPQGAVAGVLPIVRERLFFDVARWPLEGRVNAAAFEITETVPGRGGQRDFFNRVEEEQEALASLVGRLAAVLGAEHVFRARALEHHLPEQAWMRGIGEGCTAEARLQAPLPVKAGYPARPTRLLRQPVRLSLVGMRLIACGAHRRREWEALCWEGPERISTDWWKSGVAVERDYFRVPTSAGDLLWVFIRKGQAYLHGYFD